MFEVRWLQSALDDLAERWMQADGALRAAITSSVNAVDHRLSRNPTSQGESREGKERVLFVGPLGVLFEADDDSSRVYVIHVWLVRRRRK